jgi:hypothetical protein
MSLTEWVLVAGSSWAILSVSVGIPIGRAMKLADDTQLAQYPPPVPAPATPPFSQTVPDASWFDGMPVDVLSDDAVHSLFDRLVEIEGLES